MKVVVLYNFNDLSEKAQKRAVLEYVEGWQETHDVGDWLAAQAEAREILESNDDMLYSKTGRFISEGAE